MTARDASCSWLESVVVLAHLLRHFCARDKSGSYVVHTDALICSLTHLDFSDPVQNHSEQQLCAGWRKNVLVTQRCLAKQPRGGGYNVAAGMLIRPRVEALHTSSLPHTEHVGSVWHKVPLRSKRHAGQTQDAVLPVWAKGKSVHPHRKTFRERLTAWVQLSNFKKHMSANRSGFRWGQTEREQEEPCRYVGAWKHQGWPTKKSFIGKCTFPRLAGRTAPPESKQRIAWGCSSSKLIGWSTTNERKWSKVTYLPQVRKIFTIFMLVLLRVKFKACLT